MKKLEILGISCLMAAALAGCTTPKTVLKNPKTGQVAICGGSATGSLVGGVIGYNIQKANDATCAADYMGQGFKKISEDKSTY